MQTPSDLKSSLKAPGASSANKRKIKINETPTVLSKKPEDLSKYSTDHDVFDKEAL